MQIKPQKPVVVVACTIGQGSVHMSTLTRFHWYAFSLSSKTHRPIRVQTTFDRPH